MRTSATPSAMPSSTVRGRTCGRERLEHGGIEVAAGRGRWRGRPGRCGGRRPSPGRWPSSRATSSRRPPVCTNSPRLRTVVNPARSVRRPLATARSVRIAGILLHRDERAGVVGAAHEEVDLHVHEARAAGSGRRGRSRRPSSGTDVGATSTMRSPSISRSPGVDELTGHDVEHAGAAQVDRAAGECEGGPWCAPSIWGTLRRAAAGRAATAFSERRERCYRTTIAVAWPGHDRRAGHRQPPPRAGGAHRLGHDRSPGRPQHAHAGHVLRPEAGGAVGEHRSRAGRADHHRNRRRVRARWRPRRSSRAG